MHKRQIVCMLALMLFCLNAPLAFAVSDKRLQGIVDIETLVHSLDLKIFSGRKKNAETERLARERLKAAGWIPNKQGEFTIRVPNKLLSFRGDDELRHFYILTFTRNIIPEKRNPRPIITGSYLVANEDLKYANYVKMSGFGYIGRGSHTSGERFGILPFNQDFVRLLSRAQITSYIFTLTDVDVKHSKEQRRDYELYLKCRFSNKTSDYIRRQDNMKLSNQDSPNSRKIVEYLLCVDVSGAFVYNSKTERVISEWSIQP